MSSPVRNSKTGAPRKYVGFEPRENSSPENDIFQMDEDLPSAKAQSKPQPSSQAKTLNEQNLSKIPSTLAQNIASGAPDTTSSAAIPISGSLTGRGSSFGTTGGFILGTSRKASFGSPPTKSFQDRLFQRSPSQQNLVHHSGSTDELDMIAKTPPRSPRLSHITDKGKTSQSSNLKHSKKSSDSAALQQQKPPSNVPDQYQKRSSKLMTKAERRELQERQRAEKAAKLASTSTVVNQPGGTLKQSKSGSTVPQMSGSETNSTTLSRQSSAAKLTSAVSSAGKKQYKKAQILDPKAGKVVSLFAHLSQYESDMNLIREKNAKGTIHPVVIQLGVQYSENMITGGNARCLALMLALKKVIMDFTPLPGTALLRTLTQHISKQVDYLSNSRSLATSMKTAIRYVKNEITTLDINLPDEDAKKRLCDSISEFIDLRILFAHNEIVQGLLKGNKIKDGDVILTFAKSSIVSKLLIQAHTQGIQFRIIIVDSRPKLEGKDTFRDLSSRGIPCTYVMTNAIHHVIKEATKVIIGASAVFSNGDVMSRIGTSVVAMAAYDAKVPVMVLCEVYKFSDIVRLDSFVWNEIGNPEELVDISNRSISERLPSNLQSLAFNTSQITLSPSLSGWKHIQALKLLNLTYDITPAKFITMVCCELGQIPSTLVLSVLRTQHSNNA